MSKSLVLEATIWRDRGGEPFVNVACDSTRLEKPEPHSSLPDIPRNDRRVWGAVEKRTQKHVESQQRGEGGRPV